MEHVRSGPDGDLLLETPRAAPAAHQHEGVLGLRLQTPDQPPAEVGRDLHALLVVQDLQGADESGRAALARAQK